MRQWVENGATFSQEETELLLRDVPLSEIPDFTLQKMKRVHLDVWAGILPRNLGALLAERELSFDSIQVES